MTDVRVTFEKILPSGPAPEPSVTVLNWSAQEACSRNFSLNIRLSLENVSDRIHFVQAGRVVSDCTWRLTVESSPLINDGTEIKPIESVRYFHGYLVTVSEASENETQCTLDVVLAPVTLPLSFARATRSYKEKSVVDLFGDGIEKLKSLTVGQTALAPLDKHLARDDYPLWESRIQYREPDWEFLKRTLERDGLYFFFEHRELDTVIHLCDSYDQHDNVAKHDDPYVRSDRSISSIQAFSEVVPQHVCVSGYQYLTDGLNLYSSVDTDTLNSAAPVISTEKSELGRPHTVLLEGLVTPPGDVIDNSVILADLNHLVVCRAEEIVASGHFVQGVSTIPGLFPGSVITVEGFDDLCPAGEELFIAKVEHHCEKGREGVPGLSYEWAGKGPVST